MKVKYPKTTNVLRIIFGLFLLGSGLISLLSEPTGFIEQEQVESTKAFLQALLETGYIFPWIGIFKIIAGILVLIPRTAKLGVLAALPFFVNILLYTIFVAPQYLVLGIISLLLNLYLIWAYFDWYRPIWEKAERR